MKGNLLVGQSGGPTSVINASLAGVYKAAVDIGIETVYGMRYGIDGFIKGKYIDMSDYIKSDLDVELLKRTPSSFLGSCRYKLPALDTDSNDYEIIFNRLNELNIKYVLYIGGNDSMDTIQKLSEYGKRIGSDIAFVGVPKTIDNDLAATDHTPGFGSAAKYIATSVKEIIRDSKVYDIKSVTIVEIMGRNAGWLTAAAALSEGEDSTGPDMIYLPEKSFDTNKFLDRVNALADERHNIIIAVSEGIKSADGSYICDGLDGTKGVDIFGHTMLGGTALTLSGLVGSELGLKSRGIVLSTLQRSAAHIPSGCDVSEAFSAGAAGVKAAVDGMTGIMITFERVSDTPYLMKTGTADINKIANEERLVPSDWILENGLLKKDEITRYIKPLIEGELAPIMTNGLPRHLVIER
ncbi:MAG: 6-phosphofructokinase [Eubacteriales bacterium]|nr:6-phosphofructokinase [Eubacteriales bacterium]